LSNFDNSSKFYYIILTCRPAGISWKLEAGRTGRPTEKIFQIWEKLGKLGKKIFDKLGNL